MVICVRCGRQNQEDALRCDQCGAPLSQASSPAEAAPVADAGQGPSAQPAPQYAPGQQPSGTGSSGFSLFGTQIDFSSNSPFDHLGGWLLVLTIVFAISALDDLFSAITRVVSNPIGAFLSLVAAAVTAALVYLILTKDARYLLAFYAYAGMSVLTTIVTMSVASLRSAFSGFGLGVLVSGILVIAFIFTLVITVGLNVAVWYYLHTSKRVAAYFESA